MNTDITRLKGIGPARAETLRAMGIVSLRDLLYTLPIRYEDYSRVTLCAQDGQGFYLVQGKILAEPKLSVFHGLKKVTAQIADESGKLNLAWYNAPWMQKNIHPGDWLRLYGRISVKNGVRTLQNPRLIPEGETLRPVYRPIKGIPPQTLRKLIAAAMEEVDVCCPETLPEAFRKRYQLCPLSMALRETHFPSDPERLAAGRRRLFFERTLYYLLYVSGAGARREAGWAFSFPEEAEERYWKTLPFAPTGAQRRALHEIAADLKKQTAMSRLVQGDVGCGKTAVAFGAIALAQEAGFQAAMMAPTEILATQHYENALQALAPLGVRCRLLTGSTRAAERRQILTELREGSCDAVFGTHALISEGVHYLRLGLAITDEQHRFGVRQRTNLQLKGREQNALPHVLVMSATPIPRTLALILYGDLDLSVIDELPQGRIPVKTRLVPEKKRDALYRFVREEAARGRQAYIVCPLVEDSEEENAEMKSAKSLYEKLRQSALKNLRLGLTWGAQPPEEKDRVIHDFLAGETDVLVSTTVIEVGVNNPNATVMVIENAGRFGLSQLHQLRGRVGRGDLESWCFLLADGADKLKILCETGDGFQIAEKDLELRGPGDLIGTRQAGEAGNAFLSGDVRLLDEVTHCVSTLHRDPEQSALREELEARAADLFEAEGRSIALN